MAKKFIGYGDFFCSNCGERIEKGKRKCPVCRTWYSDKKYENSSAIGAGGIGWSDKINDPRFKKYEKNLKMYSYIWAVGLSIVIPIIILLPGEISLDKEGIKIIAIVLGILWVFWIAFIHLSKGNKPDWDGQVADKKVEQHTKKVKVENGYRNEHYTVYKIIFRLTDGSTKVKSSKDSRVLFDYYRIGEYVHFHGKKHLSAIEKYDKSQDEILFCIKCGAINDTRDNFCSRCGCPLLKGQPNIHTACGN